MYSDDVTICCPYHQDTHPSCSISVSKSCWYCFVCGRGGRLLELIAEIEGVSILEAALVLADLELHHKTYFGSDNAPSEKELAEERKKRLIEAYDFYQSLPKVAWDEQYHPYLMKERGFTAKTLKRFCVKLNNSGMYPMVFPLFTQGKFAGYTTRTLSDIQPKYKHNPGLPRTNLLISREAIQPGPVIITEGWLDAMMPEQHGFFNVTALLHWKIGPKQIKVLAQVATEIISATDNDGPGIEGHKEIVKAFSPYSIPVSRYSFQDGYKDLGSILSRKVFWEGMKEREMEKRIFAVA